LLLVETGAHGDRASIATSQFEEAVGAPFDVALSYDPKAAGAAENAGQPLPLAAPHGAYARQVQQLIVKLAGAAEPQQRRQFGGIRMPWQVAQAR
jgi:Flp pilus assembly CpaE family ATPase